MLRDRESKLKLYSLGIVVEDKNAGSDTIKVLPIEEFTMVEGKVSDAGESFTDQVLDAKGTAQSVNVKTGTIIEADWIPGDASNRITAPDVIKNETVRIFRFADTDDYYWATLFREPGIRRLEHVTYMFGDLREPLKAWDKQSSYWFEVSTRDKHVKLHTAKSDGEPFVYDFVIDTGNGTVELKDDIGNFVKLDSQQSDLTIETNKTLNANIGNKVTVNTEQVVVNASESAEVNTPDATVNSDTTTVNASSEFKVDSPKSVFTGDVEIQKNLNVTLAIGGTGGMSLNNTTGATPGGGIGVFDGSIAVTGNADIGGTMSAGNCVCPNCNCA